MKTALLAGATGLIGSQLLSILLDDPAYGKIVAITRKELKEFHPKLDNVVVDFDHLHTVKERLAADDVFCCLGTTIKKAGSKEQFRKVDYDYPIMLATIGRELGAKQYLLVSALGANKNSSIFYNQVKGEVEDSIQGVNYRTLHIFRPSLLMGPRQETRTGEDAAKAFYKIFGFLIPKKYKGIESIKVARAMRFFAHEEVPGKHIHESSSLQSF